MDEEAFTLTGIAFPVAPTTLGGFTIDGFQWDEYGDDDIPSPGPILRRVRASRMIRAKRIMRGMNFPTETVVKTPEEAIAYVLDYRVFEEVSIDEGEISDPDTSSTARITVGTPTVSETAINGLPIGQAVLLPISGGVAGDEYQVDCWATITTDLGTSIRGYRLNVHVR